VSQRSEITLLALTLSSVFLYQNTHIPVGVQICSYARVSTPLSRVVELMHCADGFTFPLTCQSEKLSELNAWLGLCVCLPFYPGGGPGLFTEQLMVGGLKSAML